MHARSQSQVVNRRIAFLGGKPLSARCLLRLHPYHQAGEIEIVAVLPRAPGERGWWSGDGVPEIGETAEALRLPVIGHAEELLRLELDLGISVLHASILDARVIDHARNGFINLHLAPLPEYRGCNCCSHALMNNEAQFGVSLHHMDEKPDHGDVIRVDRFDIDPNDTARTLMARAEQAAIVLFDSMITSILAGKLTGTPQEELIRQRGVRSRYYPRASLQMPGAKRIELSWPACKINRHVRALDFPPFEPAHAVVDGATVYLSATNPYEVEQPLRSGASRRNGQPFRSLITIGTPDATSRERVSGRIPLVDLDAHHAPLREELDDAIAEVATSGTFIGGPVVARFASEFAAYCGTEHAVPCSNGTEALRLALVAVMGQGDAHREIILPSLTFAATAEAVIAAGYVPRFVDVHPETYVITAELAESVRNERTVAVVPVHLYGQMVDMVELMTWARRYGLAVIEDAAQAHGAAFAGVRPGQDSDAAAFSCFPGKNLGAWGDAGAVVCNDQRTASVVEMLRDHGRREKHVHQAIGWNSRMDALQAAVLRVKLPHLEQWNASRRRIAAEYDRRLGGRAGIVRPAVDDRARHVYHQYVIQAECRNHLRRALGATGITTGVHYPIPLHRQPAFAAFQCKGTDLPETDRICRRVVSLPVYPELPATDVRRIADAVIAAVNDTNGVIAGYGAGKR